MRALEAERRRQGLTRAQLAKAARVELRILAALEEGRPALAPSTVPGSMFKLAEALGWLGAVGELMDEADDPTTDGRHFVRLTEAEMQQGEREARFRAETAVSRGLTNLDGRKGYGNLENHIPAAQAELAFRKLVAGAWTSEGTGPTKAGDVDDAEVRWQRGLQGRLIIRPKNDKMDRDYVLVVGTPPDFWICGFLPAREAVRPEWYLAPSQGYSNDAYQVPQAALRPFDVDDYKRRHQP